MNFKVGEAVSKAISYVEELYAREGITNVGLEEVEFDRREGAWRVTVGFTRPWDQPPRPAGALAAVVESRTLPRRTYKLLRIDDESGEVVGLVNREIDA